LIKKSAWVFGFLVLMTLAWAGAIASDGYCFEELQVNHTVYLPHISGGSSGAVIKSCSIPPMTSNPTIFPTNTPEPAATPTLVPTKTESSMSMDKVLLLKDGVLYNIRESGNGGFEVYHYETTETLPVVAHMWHEEGPYHLYALSDGTLKYTDQIGIIKGTLNHLSAPDAKDLYYSLGGQQFFVYVTSSGQINYASILMDATLKESPESAGTITPIDSATYDNSGFGYMSAGGKIYYTNDYINGTYTMDVDTSETLVYLDIISDTLIYAWNADYTKLYEINPVAQTVNVRTESSGGSEETMSYEDFYLGLNLHGNVIDNAVLPQKTSATANAGEYYIDTVTGYVAFKKMDGTDVFVQSAGGAAGDMIALNGDAVIEPSYIASMDQLPTATADLSIGGHRLTNVGAGIDPTDGVNLSQLQEMVTGNVFAMPNAQMVITDPGQSLAIGTVINQDQILPDGTVVAHSVTVAEGHVFIRDLPSSTENGWWVVGAGDTLTRLAYADAMEEIERGYGYVLYGSAARTIQSPYLQSGITLDVDAIFTFEPIRDYQGIAQFDVVSSSGDGVALVSSSGNEIVGKTISAGDYLAQSLDGNGGVIIALDWSGLDTQLGVEGYLKQAAIQGLIDTAVAPKADQTSVTAQINSLDTTLRTLISAKVAQADYDDRIIVVDNALSLKADTDYVDSEVETLNTAIGTKVAKTAYDTFVSDTNTALGTKASTTYVDSIDTALRGLIDQKVAQDDYDLFVGATNTALSQKASTTYVDNIDTALRGLIDQKVAQDDYDQFVGDTNTALSTKADTAYVDGQVSTLNTAIGTKVAKTDYDTFVSGYNTFVTDTNAELDKMQRQFKVSFPAGNRARVTVDTAYSVDTADFEVYNSVTHQKARASIAVDPATNSVEISVAGTNADLSTLYGLLEVNKVGAITTLDAVAI